MCEVDGKKLTKNGIVLKTYSFDQSVIHLVFAIPGAGQIAEIGR